MDTLKLCDVFEPYYEGKPGGFAGKVKPEAVRAAAKAVNRFRQHNRAGQAADTDQRPASRDTDR